MKGTNDCIALYVRLCDIPLSLPGDIHKAPKLNRKDGDWWEGWVTVPRSEGVVKYQYVVMAETHRYEVKGLPFCFFLYTPALNAFTRISFSHSSLFLHTRHMLTRRRRVLSCVPRLRREDT